MSSQPRPHLNLQREATRAYRARPQRIAPPDLPEREVSSHSQRLSAELDAALRAAHTGPSLGANAAVDLAPGISPDEVDLARGASAYVDTSEECAVVFFPDAEAKTLHRKLREYADPTKVGRTTGAPRNNKLVARIEQIRRPTLNDLAGPWDIESGLASTSDGVWIELWTPGGRLGDEQLRGAIQLATEAFVNEHGRAGSVVRFEASEHDIYMAHLSVEGVHLLPAKLPAVTSVHQPSQARLERIARAAVNQVVEADRITPPHDSAPTIAILDSGIAEDHPLIQPVLVAPGASVVPGIATAHDGYPTGHGTCMAGAVAYPELAMQVANGEPVQARSKIANVRLWSPSPASEPFWASRTEEAVAAAEAMTSVVAAHVLCISSGERPPKPRTSWSFAVDRLAYNDGNGRLICVASGTVSAEADPAAYPASNQAAELHDPAQAMNALSVGGYTNLDAVLPTRGGLTPVARAGELSPHTTTGTIAGPIKPDVLMEAGNACPDGSIPASGLEELSVLTTSSRHAQGRFLESDYGTSIATATAAALVGELFAANPAHRPETIRALIVNSATWPDALKHQFPEKSERLRCAGYGVPRRDRALASTASRATLIHEGRMTPYSSAGRLEALHLLRLPLPQSELLELGGAPVSLAVTLSYFIEPHETRRTRYAGALLHWDLQRQSESEEDFRARINDRDRDPQAPPADYDGWRWEIGVNARRRGSVQGDRLTVEAAALAGDRLVAVFPAGGWWKDHLRERAGREIRYSLVITVDLGSADIDVYSLIAARLPVEIPVDAS